MLIPLRMICIYTWINGVTLEKSQAKMHTCRKKIWIISLRHVNTWNTKLKHNMCCESLQKSYMGSTQIFLIRMDPKSRLIFMIFISGTKPAWIFYLEKNWKQLDEWWNRISQLRSHGLCVGYQQPVDWQISFVFLQHSRARVSCT